MNKNLLVVPSGRLALDPTKLKSAKKVAKDLVEGRPVQLGDNGDTTGKERTKLTTQPGKLALDPTKIKSAGRQRRHYWERTHRIDHATWQAGCSMV